MIHVLGNGARYSDPQDINAIMALSPYGLSKKRGKKTKSSVEYVDLPVAFDIETTSFIENGEKAATMYAWMISINGEVVLGRDWGAFIEAYHQMVAFYKTGKDRHLVIFVHNLQFEFQFIRKWFEWDTVFANEERAPIYAVTKEGVEFRCSYILSGYKLAKLPDMVKAPTARKLEGDLDYRLFRHPRTPLTDEELAYCVNDVIVVTDYIREKMNDETGLAEMPITKTGYVRRTCRTHCLRSRSYSSLIQSLTLTPEEFVVCRTAFCGGFTHANSRAVDKVFHDVNSRDLTSSYPAVLCSEQFPMSRPIKITPHSAEEVRNTMKKYCTIMVVTLHDVAEKFIYEHVISSSRCTIRGRRTIDNGRVVYADEIDMIVTGVEFEYLEKFYDFQAEVKLIYAFMKSYLPKEFLECIVSFYEKKTILKGIDDMKAEYQRAKENTNSCYGMIVTDPCKKDIVYGKDQWGGKEEIDPATKSILEENDRYTKVNKYNKSRNRFLYYPWGVFVTAYARCNLYKSILENGPDHIYSDTDSDKLINSEKHEAFYEQYNAEIQEKIRRCLTSRGIDPERARPKNKKGKVCPLGVWDNEGTYARFKTLGAKRYMTESYDGEIDTTVAGCGKKYMEGDLSLPSLLKDFADGVYDPPENIDGPETDPFSYFTTGLVVPASHTKKLEHRYNDNEIKTVLVDYTGTPCEIYEKSSCYLGPMEFRFSRSDEFREYLFESAFVDIQR